MSGATSADLVAVFGVGGLGHLAVQYARITGAAVVAVDTNEERLRPRRRARRRARRARRRAGSRSPRSSASAAPTSAIATAVNPSRVRAGDRARSPAAARLVCVGLPADERMRVPIFETVLGGLDDPRLDRRHAPRPRGGVRAAPPRPDARCSRAERRWTTSTTRSSRCSTAARPQPRAPCCGRCRWPTPGRRPAPRRHGGGRTRVRPHGRLRAGRRHRPADAPQRRDSRRAVTPGPPLEPVERLLPRPPLRPGRADVAGGRAPAPVARPERAACAAGAPPGPARWRRSSSTRWRCCCGRPPALRAGRRHARAGGRDRRRDRPQRGRRVRPGAAGRARGRGAARVTCRRRRRCCGTAAREQVDARASWCPATCSCSRRATASRPTRGWSTGAVEVDMSALTGESVPVLRARRRSTTPTRRCSRRGTSCSAGRCAPAARRAASCYATGMRTELGRDRGAVAARRPARRARSSARCGGWRG